MVKATNWLSAEEKSSVKGAIKAAEVRTRCEYVCVVATRSGEYAKALAWWSLVGACLGLLGAGLVHQWSQQQGSWEYLHMAPFVPSLLGLVLGSLVMQSLVKRIPAALLMFAPSAHEAQTVERTASFLFGKHKVSHTEERNGLLVYVSLAEHKLVIMADRGALQVLGNQGISDLMSVGQEKLAQGEGASALCSVIELAAEKLEASFPGNEEDENELTDELILLHPYPA